MSQYETFGETRLPPPLQARVEAELDKNERLLWVGQPNPRRFMLQALPILLFGIPFTAFAVFWMVIASGMMFGAADMMDGFGGGIFACFPLFGLPFLFIGLAMLTAPLWMARRAGQTFYALTDQRAILWEANLWGGVAVRMYRGPDLTRMRRNEYNDGSGDLIFEEYVTLSHGPGHSDFHGDYGRRVRWNRQQHGFLAIPRVREVEEIVRKVLLAQPEKGKDGS